MRLFIPLFLTTLFLLVTAQAQDTATLDIPEGQALWGGVSVGAPGVALHFGAEDLIASGVDVRGNLGFDYLFASGIALGADAIVDLNMETDDLPVRAYAGAGPLLVFGEQFALGIDTFLGGEYRLTNANFSEGGLFLELGPTLYVVPLEFGFTGRLGFNYHFTLE